MPKLKKKKDEYCARLQLEKLNEYIGETENGEPITADIYVDESGERKEIVRFVPSAVERMLESEPLKPDTTPRFCKNHEPHGPLYECLRCRPIYNRWLAKQAKALGYKGLEQARGELVAAGIITMA